MNVNPASNGRLLSALNRAAIDPKWCITYKAEVGNHVEPYHRAASERRGGALAKSMEVALQSLGGGDTRGKAVLLTTSLTLCHFVITSSQIGKETSSGS